MGLYNDLTLNSGEYQQQYAGSPLAELQQTGNVLANRHYQNIAEMSAMELALKQMQANALPGAREYIAQQVGQVHGELEKMAELGAENSTAKVAALKNAFLGDEGLIHTQQRAQEYAAKQALANEITSKTGRDAVFKKGIFEELANAPVYTQDEEGNTILNPLYSKQFSPHISPYLDPTIDYKRITDEIKPDAWLSQGLTGEQLVTFQKAHTQLANGEIDIPKFVKYMESAGITGAKLDRLKNRMFDAFKNTSSYTQQKEYFDRTDEQQKEDLFNYAKLGQYQQDKSHFMQISGGSGDGGSGNTTLMGAGTVLDPAVIQEKVRTPMPWDFSAGVGPNTRNWGALMGDTKQTTKEQIQASNENYQNAAKAALEYYGMNPSGELGPLAPGQTPRDATPEEVQKFINSDKGKELTKKFFDEAYKDELSNAYASTVDPKTAKVLDDFLLRNPQGLKYFNAQGEEIPMLDDKGRIKEDWKELTGGDSDSFNYANTLNPMNFRAGAIGEDSAANGLHQVNAHTKDGMFSFYVTNPAEYNPQKKNVTILYNKLWSTPGVYQPTPDGNQAKVLVGKQKEAAWNTHKDELTKQYGANARRMFEASQGLTEVKLPDGRVMLTTIEALGLSLANNGVELSFKQ